MLPEFVRRFVKSRTTAGVRLALHNLRNEVRLQRLHLASLKKAKRFAGQKNLKLNIGCGTNPRAGWVNIDFQKYADLHLDLRERFPFENESVSFIYSEHFVEHLEYPREAQHVFRESLRVLVPGGVFSVGVPDVEGGLRDYALLPVDRNAPAEAVQAQDGELSWVPPYVFTTYLHQINWLFRMGTEHKYAYDFETLAQSLGAAGFVDIRRREFNPELDSETRRIGTLYVDAHKSR